MGAQLRFLHPRHALVALVLLGAGALRAQGQGVGTLTGTAVDASTHVPLPKVVVTVTSPQMQGAQGVKTDASGTYFVPQLPPGTYKVSFEKEGYKPFARADIPLDADRMLRVDAQLRSEADQSGVP